MVARKETIKTLLSWSKAEWIRFPVMHRLIGLRWSWISFLSLTPLFPLHITISFLLNSYQSLSLVSTAFFVHRLLRFSSSFFSYTWYLFYFPGSSSLVIWCVSCFREKDGSLGRQSNFLMRGQATLLPVTFAKCPASLISISFVTEKLFSLFLTSVNVWYCIFVDT